MRWRVCNDAAGIDIPYPSAVCRPLRTPSAELEGHELEMRQQPFANLRRQRSQQFVGWGCTGTHVARLLSRRMRDDRLSYEGLATNDCQTSTNPDGVCGAVHIAAATRLCRYNGSQSNISSYGRLPCRPIVLRPRRLLSGLAVSLGDFCDPMLRRLPSVGPRFAPTGLLADAAVDAFSIASTMDRCGES